MAINFPNFLAAAINKPDYSGISDSVDNFYKGYNMPKDALIKEIQARFAEPNAKADLESTSLKNTYQGILNKYAPQEKEQSLATGRITNRKSQLDLDTALLEYQQQQELQKQFIRALAGAQATPPVAPISTQSPAPPIPPMAQQPMIPNAPAMNPAAQGAMPLPGQPKGLPVPTPTPGMSLVGSSPAGLPPAPMQNGAPAAVTPTAAMPGMPNAGSPASAALAGQQPSLPPAQPEAPNEVVVKKGEPALSGVDAMYDSNPLSRAFLEKKGYKKTQEVKFDNKTGRTTIITKYPSGKVTVTASSAPPPVGDNGIPLTNKMISKHQNIISSIDNALPTIEKIIDQGGKNAKGIAASWEPYPRNSWRGLGMIPGFQSASTNYEALVSSALDSLIGAYGLPSTNEGIETVKKQLLIGHGETDSAYRKRLRELVKDLQKRKAYSSGEVKKSNKISPVDSSASGASDQDRYSSNDWEEVSNGQ